jgi:hypothetical protein
MEANINSAHAPEFLQELIKFMKVMDWMMRNHGIRFLTENVWDQVPLSWRDALMQLSEEELYMLPVDPSVRRKTWPLSLQAFFKCVDRYQLANIVPSLQSVFKSNPQKLYGFIPTPQLNRRVLRCRSFLLLELRNGLESLFLE